MQLTESRLKGSVLEVWYDVTLERQALHGGYGSVDGDFTSAHFPPSKSGSVTVVGPQLVPARALISNDAALKMIDALGMRPADAYELCAFGRAFPEAQLVHRIPALGGPMWPVPRDGESAAYLDGWHAVRELLLHGVRFGWCANSMFLAFPKE